MSPRRRFAGQSFNRFPREVRGKVGVAAGCPQTRMAYLALSEIRRDTVLLQVAHAAMPKGVHTARSGSDTFAERFQNPPANVSVFQWRANSRLEHAARRTAAEMFLELLNSGGVNPHIPIALSRLGCYFHPLQTERRTRIIPRTKSKS